MAKRALVVASAAPPGSQNIHEIDVHPGSTAGDVLRSLNLQGYLLSREGSGQYWAETEEIYGQIEDDAKLRAVPVAEVGGWGFFDLLKWLVGGGGVKPQVHSRLANTRPRHGATVPIGGHRQVRADDRPLWQIRGWHGDHNKLIGAYRTGLGRSYSGEIDLKGGAPTFYIIDPPLALFGSHTACFRPRGAGRFYIHFASIDGPDMIDAGIAAVERLLRDCQQRKG